MNLGIELRMELYIMHIFHNWGKWKVESDRVVKYTTIMNMTGTVREIVQSKECSKCGLKIYKTTDIE